MNIHFKLFFVFILLTNVVGYTQNTFQHRVVKGESISVIAEKYSVKQAAIYELNPTIKGKVLRINAVLQIPITIASSTKLDSIPLTSIIVEKQTHKVKSGETLTKISNKYGIPLQEIKRLNPTVLKTLPIGYLLILKEEEVVVENTSESIENFVEASTTEILDDSLSTYFNTANLIETSSKYIGTRYKKGGVTNKGFDCSGFVYTTFKENEITLPRSSKEQAQVGVKISQSEAKVGDLIFFSTNGSKTINHVGIIVEILGDELKFIHSSLKLGVVVSSIKELYYLKRFVQINRVF
jgi:cell wall-associated NlpC family hydrolase